MRPASLGTGTDRFRRPGERWRPRQVSVGRRPVILLTGIRDETARGPSHGSGRPRGGATLACGRRGAAYIRRWAIAAHVSIGPKHSIRGGWVDPEGDYCFAC